MMGKPDDKNVLITGASHGQLPTPADPKLSKK